MATLDPGAIAQVLFSTAAGVFLLLLLAKVMRIRAANLLCIELFLAGFLLRLGLLFINENFQFFEHKYAGERSVEFYLKCIAGDGRLIDMFRDQFALQVLFNTPFFVMFGASLMTVTISNCFVSALTAPLVGLLLHNPFGDRVARRGLMLFFLYPGSVNFSLFGLRDPLIFLAMTLFATGAIAVYANCSRQIYATLSVFGGTCLLILRPEMAYVTIALVGMLLLPWLKSVVAANQRPIEKLATVR